MPLSTFERFLPWSGAIAGLCWIGQALLLQAGQPATHRDKRRPRSSTTTWPSTTARSPAWY